MPIGAFIDPGPPSSSSPTTTFLPSANSRATHQMWCPVNIAKVGLEEEEEEHQQHGQEQEHEHKDMDRLQGASSPLPAPPPSPPQAATPRGVEARRGAVEGEVERAKQSGEIFSPPSTPRTGEAAETGAAVRPLSAGAGAAGRNRERRTSSDESDGMTEIP